MTSFQPAAFAVCSGDMDCGLRCQGRLVNLPVSRCTPREEMLHPKCRTLEHKNAQGVLQIYFRVASVFTLQAPWNFSSLTTDSQIPLTTSGCMGISWS